MAIAENLKRIRKKLGLSQPRLAALSGVSQQLISQIENGKNDTTKALPSLARALGVPVQELDPTYSDVVEFPVTRRNEIVPNALITSEPLELPRRLIPVYGVAMGGQDGRLKFNGERLDMVLCPPGLEHAANAYAVYVSGESMAPVYRPGQTLWVNPHIEARIGHDVIVQLRPRHDGDVPEGFIKELVKRTPTKLVLKQYNPEMEITFDANEVLSVHPVVFSSRR